MKKIEQQYLTGERALFHANDMEIHYTTFADGESPLKESENISLYHSMFKWKYPLWYSKNVTLVNCTLFEMARAGIWYSHHVCLTDCIIEAPKIFRRSTDIQLKNVTIPNAEETFWNCDGVQMENVSAKGGYFAMNSTDITINGLDLLGNYAFDGCKTVTIRNAKILSKDAFWNCENVIVYDSFISGEYLGWNAKNVTFVNCTVESNQGMCYIENIVMKNCRLLNTTLAFEYSSVDAQIYGCIDSVKNPASGVIRAERIGELILEENRINPTSTAIITEDLKNAV